eukprot:SAG31_NODE_14075_length_828_cov_1.399177_1_plen_77_part_10
MNCQKYKPEALEIFHELQVCFKAFAYPFDTLQGDVSKIEADVKFLAKAAKAAPTDSDDDNMRDIVEQFHNSCEPKMV